MTEIKLRAWDGTKMHYLSIERFDDMVAFRSPEHFEGEVQLSRYTGVQDFDGVEIYEGDIIEVVELWHNKIRMNAGVVSYGQCGFWLIDDTLDNFVDLTLSVIGNIYEHPETLAKVLEKQVNEGRVRAIRVRSEELSDTSVSSIGITEKECDEVLHTLRKIDKGE